MKSEMQGRMARALDIPEKELKTEDENDNCSKCDDLDKLIDIIQAKIAVSSRKEKIKLLTLVPESWSIENYIEKFHVTEYMVKKSKSIKERTWCLGRTKT